MLGAPGAWNLADGTGTLPWAGSTRANPAGIRIGPLPVFALQAFQLVPKAQLLALQPGEFRFVGARAAVLLGDQALDGGVPIFQRAKP